MKVNDEQFKVDGFTNPDDIIESFVEHAPIDKWANQFTEDELELMQEHLSYNDTVECYNAIQRQIDDIKRERYLEVVKKVKWWDIAPFIHPSGLEVELISREQHKSIGNMRSFNGLDYRLNLTIDYYTLD